VGNPPFMAGGKISGAMGESYRDWLKEVHTESHGNADLVAHFFRRTFSSVRNGGTLGLIATNTIGQGDTRSSGLRWIGTNDGHIYWAKRRFVWPGQASVVVSVVHISKSTQPARRMLDGKTVDVITAFLFHAGGHEDASPLMENQSKSYLGSKIYGQGFTFDDTDNTGVANPISAMHDLITSSARNAEKIFPYIGGAELNNDPSQEHHRYVINFGDATEEESRKWPELMRIVEEKVKPVRMAQKREIRRRYWWKFGEPTPALFNAKKNLTRVLVTAFTSDTFAFSWQPSERVFPHSIVVFTVEDDAFFAVLQSRPHEVWARTFGSTMKDDSCYTASDCFDPFPFPNNADFEHDLREIGRQYYAIRAQLMLNNDEGLTKTYNRFRDPHEQSEGILELRRLHGLMDGAVLRAYGWDDLAESARCEFLLDYEDGDQVSGDGGQGEDSGPDTRSLTPGPRRRKRLPWRLRWPDEFRDEVLARLLELNEQRHKEELLAGKSATSKRASSDNDDEDGEDDDDDTVDSDDAPTPKKSTRTTKAGRSTKKTKKSKKPPASGQKEMEF